MLKSILNLKKCFNRIITGANFGSTKMSNKKNFQLKTRAKITYASSPPADRESWPPTDFCRFPPPPLWAQWEPFRVNSAREKLKYPASTLWAGHFAVARLVSPMSIRCKWQWERSASHSRTSDSRQPSSRQLNKVVYRLQRLSRASKEIQGCERRFLRTSWF